MKILQVVPFFSPFHGGSAVSAYQLSAELARAGNEMTVLTSDSRLSRDWVESQNKIEVRYFKAWTSYANSYFTPTMMNFVRREFKNFDLIHMHNYRTYQNIVAGHYAAKYHIPYVLQPHGTLPRIMTRQNLKWVYDVTFGFRVLKGASKIIALNKTEVQQCKDIGVSERKITVIPNGIDLLDYANIPPEGSFKAKYGISADRKVILYLGRIHKIKGIDFLVKAYAKLIDRMGIDNTLLVIAGPDDGYLNMLRSLVSQLKLEHNVFLTGPLYDKNKLEAYVDAEVYVLPSRYETFPSTVLEAYACSRPVVASNVGSLSDIVLHKKTGLLFRAGDIQELTEATEYILTNPKEAKNMGKEARKFAEENFSIARISDLLEILYEEILGASKG